MDDDQQEEVMQETQTQNGNTQDGDTQDEDNRCPLSQVHSFYLVVLFMTPCSGK